MVRGRRNKPQPAGIERRVVKRTPCADLPGFEEYDLSCGHVVVRRSYRGIVNRNCPWCLAMRNRRKHGGDHQAGAQQQDRCA